METVDWSCPHALLAAIHARREPRMRVIMAAGAGERVMDALAAETAQTHITVVACAETVAARALLELRVAALRTLDREQAWALLGEGRVSGEIAAVLVAGMSDEAAGFWRRRAYALGNLYRHGRSGWLLWLADLAARACGVDWDRWHTARWRVNAALWAAFNASPVSPALFLRTPDAEPWSWHAYAMARLEAAFGSGSGSRRACQWDVVRYGAYRENDAPPYLQRNSGEWWGVLDVRPTCLASALQSGEYDLIVIGSDLAALPHVPRALTPTGVVLAWSVEDAPHALLDAMKKVGLGRAERMADVAPGAFAGHWLFRQ